MFCKACTTFWAGMQKALDGGKHFFTFRLYTSLNEASANITACRLCSHIVYELNNVKETQGVIFLQISPQHVEEHGFKDRSNTTNFWNGYSLRVLLDDKGWGVVIGYIYEVEVGESSQKSAQFSDVNQTMFLHPEKYYENTGSDAIFRVARDWLHKCSKTHSCNNTDKLSRLPSRVVDVGSLDGSIDPFLFETHDAVGDYLSLGHCWGEQHNSSMITTTKENLPSRLQCIPFSSMPQTFKDAVTIARKFGVQYLWIDALCIIQNLPSDWEVESAKMADIYQNSLFTIAAAHGQDSSAGCFVSREKHFEPRIRLPLQYAEWPANEIYLQPVSKEPYLWPNHDNPPERVLRTRAWTLQERILSRRILSYDDDRLSWYCLETQEMARLYPTIKPQPIGNVSLYRSDERTVSFACTFPKEAEYGRYDAWVSLLAEYSSRKLSFSSDRLIAIYGIAKRLEKSLGDQYCAGLWRSILDLDLMWSVVRYEGQSSPSRNLSAPSWSWASINGAIFHPAATGFVNFANQYLRLCRIEDVSIEGSPSQLSGKITLECDCWIGAFKNGGHSPGVRWDHQDHDLEDFSNAIIIAIIAKPPDLNHRTGLLTFSSVNCLVLLPLDGELDQFRRVGSTSLNWDIWFQTTYHGKHNQNIDPQYIGSTWRTWSATSDQWDPIDAFLEMRNWYGDQNMRERKVITLV